jgi:hypothetical protein
MADQAPLLLGMHTVGCLEGGKLPVVDMIMTGSVVFSLLRKDVCLLS